jgi:hypothetical protein
MELHFDVLRMGHAERSHVCLVGLADGHPHVLAADGALLVTAELLERRPEELGFLAALHLLEIE